MNSLRYRFISSRNVPFAGSAKLNKVIREQQVMLDKDIARFVLPYDAAQERTSERLKKTVGETVGETSGKMSVKTSGKSSGETLLKTLGKTTQETTQEKMKPRHLSAAKDKGRISEAHANRLTCLGLRTHV